MTAFDDEMRKLKKTLDENAEWMRELMSPPALVTASDVRELNETFADLNRRISDCLNKPK